MADAGPAAPSAKRAGPPLRGHELLLRVASAVVLAPLAIGTAFEGYVPKTRVLRYEAGMIFLRNGFTQDGLHWLSTALDVDPNHRPTHQALADHFQRTGEQARARQHRQFLDQP